MHGWYDHTGVEIVGLQLLNKVNTCLGKTVLVSLDKLFSCMIFNNIKQFIRKYKNDIHKGASNFDDLWQRLQPCSKIPDGGKALYVQIVNQLKTLALSYSGLFMQIGQLQLLRRLIGYQLNFAGRIEATYLWTALKSLNTSIINDINTLDSVGEELVIECDQYLTQMGFAEPFEKVYIKPGEVLSKLPLMMAMFVITQITQTMTYDARFGGLVKKGKTDVIDGATYIAGVLTIFRQFHSEHLISFLGYLG
jgi:WASH complex subunit strumpellin